MLTIVMTIMAAASVFAQDPWPPDVFVSPQCPSPSDVITLTVSDTWTTDCIPSGITSTQVQGNSLYITLNQPCYFVCNPKLVSWQYTCTVGPLAAGCYDVHVGSSGCGTVPPAKAATFCVGAGTTLILPYEGSVSEPGKAFRVNNTYAGMETSYGGYFQADGAQGRGVYARSTSTVPDVNTYGGFFYAAGPKGRGVFGQSAGAEGTGVKGWASNDGDVQNYGGHFCATGARGIGVYGWAENTGDAENFGGVFLAEGARGIGVLAQGGPQGVAGQFDGDTLITGRGNGIIFPDGTKQTTAANGGGSSAGCCAKPAYDSGWVATPPGSPTQTFQKQLKHNLGGNVDDYVVDLQTKHTTIAGPQPPTNQGIGSTFYYAGLTTTNIILCGPGSAIDAGTSLRVRIWVCNCDGGAGPEPN